MGCTALAEHSCLGKTGGFQGRSQNVSRGWLIKFNFGDRDVNVLKGARGTITNLSEKAISISLESGEKAKVPLDSFAACGLDYGYTLTAQSYQGKRVKDILIGTSHVARLSRRTWQMRTRIAIVKEVNMWLDQAIKPIAQTRAETDKKRIGDGRIPEEEDVTQSTIQHAEVGQVMREQEPELFQDRDMGMER